MTSLKLVRHINANSAILLKLSENVLIVNLK